MALLEADDELWNRFLLRGLGPAISRDANLRELFHFYSAEKLYALGREISPGDDLEAGALPALEWGRLLDYPGTDLHPATEEEYRPRPGSGEDLERGFGRGESASGPCRNVPSRRKRRPSPKSGGETFDPLHDWLRAAALAFGRRVANAYEAFRLSEAVLTYDDQVRLALRVLEHPAARRELASERLSVLLDEAQDTDRRQFEVLRRVAGLGENPDQADDQSFCIVGDFQQAIYAPRSDLEMYQRVHDEVSTGPRGTGSRLQVTFRCDVAIIDFVNRIFPILLNHAGGQCAFEPLVAREDARPGRVTRWVCPDEPAHAAGEKISAEVRARHEARFVARRMQALGPAGFGASDWSQVAVLCPRKNWLLQIQRELADLGLPVQLHSSNEQRRDRTPGAWLTALVWIAAHPEDSFEIAGVLREILGVSDSATALYTRGDGDRLRLDHAAAGDEGEVASALTLLREACAQADAMPLYQVLHQLLEKTQLRERLNAIVEMELEDAGRELDDFLAVIAGRIAAGVTLAGLAEELRLGLAQVYPAEEEIRDAIQLLTSHKAKGPRVGGSDRALCLSHD